MKKHINILSVIYCITGGSYILIALIFILLTRSSDSFIHDPDMHAVKLYVCISFVFALLALIGGIGLRQYKPWGKWTIIVVGCLYAVAFPIGTALCVYTMWVLWDKEVKLLFADSTEDSTEETDAALPKEPVEGTDYRNVKKHIKILSISHIIFNGLCISLAVYHLIEAYLKRPDTISVAARVTILGRFAQSDIMLFLFSLLGLLGAIELLKYKHWARIIVIFTGFIQLANLPVGTILGVYTMWVLFRKDTGRLFADHGTASAEV